MLFFIDLYVLYPKVRQVQGLKSVRPIRGSEISLSYAKYHGIVDIS